MGLLPNTQWSFLELLPVLPEDYNVCHDVRKSECPIDSILCWLPSQNLKHQQHLAKQKISVGGTMQETFPAAKYLSRPSTPPASRFHNGTTASAWACTWLSVMLLKNYGSITPADVHSFFARRRYAKMATAESKVHSTTKTAYPW